MEPALITPLISLAFIICSTPVALGPIVLYSITSHDRKLWEDMDMYTVYFLCQTESVILRGDSICIL